MVPEKDIDKREDHRLPPASFHGQSINLLSCRSVSSVAQSCLTLCDPMDCSMLSFPVHHQLLDLLKLMSIELVMPSNHLILCRPFLLLPSIFSSIGSFPRSHFSASSGQSIGVSASVQSFQWIFRTDFLQDWQVSSPFSPRDSQESSPNWTQKKKVEEIHTHL